MMESTFHSSFFLCQSNMESLCKWVKTEEHHLAQWFPTFLASWTLLMIWLKAVDPLMKPDNTLLMDLWLNRPKDIFNLILEMYL